MGTGPPLYLYFNLIAHGFLSILNMLYYHLLFRRYY